jgi:hypothetical protein
MKQYQLVSCFPDEGGEEGTEDEKELPFALTDIDVLPASDADDSPLPDMEVKHTPASNVTEHCIVESTTPPVETHISIVCQIVVPFFIAGMGMVGAGFYLDHVQVSLYLNTVLHNSYTNFQGN